MCESVIWQLAHLAGPHHAHAVAVLCAKPKGSLGDRWRAGSKGQSRHLGKQACVQCTSRQQRLASVP